MTDQEIIYKAITEVVNTDKPAEFAAHNSTCYTIAKYVCEEMREELKSLLAEQPSEDLEKEIDKQWNEEYRPYDSGYTIAELSLSDYKETARHFAQWQKEQMLKSAVSIGYLQDWYQNSIDEDVPPIWTDKHLNELTKDFYLIPKQKEDK